MNRFDCYFGSVTLRANGRHLHDEGEYVLASEHDAMIDRLLQLLEPGDEPPMPKDGSTLADWNWWSALHNPWRTKKELYDQAAKIAERAS